MITFAGIVNAITALATAAGKIADAVRESSARNEKQRAFDQLRQLRDQHEILQANMFTASRNGNTDGVHSMLNAIAACKRDQEAIARIAYGSGGPEAPRPAASDAAGKGN